MTDEVIPIGDVCAVIAARTGSPPSRGHRKIQQLALDAPLPSAHRIRGRWHVRADAIPEIIAGLAQALKPSRSTPT